MWERSALRGTVLLLSAVLVLTGCVPVAAVRPAPATLLPMVVPPGTPAQADDTRFSLTALQARQVAATVAFIQAYNAGHVEEAVGWLDDAVVASDCDYERADVLLVSGKAQARQWLAQRAANHDRLTMSRVWNENPDDQSVVGITYERRTSDSLARLGFANGITPKLATKVVFRDHPLRIIAFANGPGGGNRLICRARN